MARAMHLNVLHSNGSGAAFFARLMTKTNSATRATSQLLSVDGFVDVENLHQIDVGGLVG